MGESMSNDSDKPSVAELKHIEQEMPKGQWALTSDAGARATIRLLDAVPVLLEIAETAKALEKIKAAAAKARHAYYRCFDDRLLPAVDEHDKELFRCRKAYDDALAKVRE